MTLLQFFGLETTGDHARLVLAVIGGAIAVGGFIAGRWSNYRSRVHFEREDLVTSSIILEIYGLRTEPEGGDMLHIVTQAALRPLESFFLNPDLVRHVKREAVKHPGLLLLPNPVAHRMMMDEGKDKITGQQAKANMDFVVARPRTTRPSSVSPPTGNANMVEMDCTIKSLGLFLMVVSPTAIERLAEPTGR